MRHFNGTVILELIADTFILIDPDSDEILLTAAGKKDEINENSGDHRNSSYDTDDEARLFFRGRTIDRGVVGIAVIVNRGSIALPGLGSRSRCCRLRIAVNKNSSLGVLSRCRCRRHLTRGCTAGNAEGLACFYGSAALAAKFCHIHNLRELISITVIIL